MAYTATQWRKIKDPLKLSHTTSNFPLLGNPRKYFYSTRRSPILGICMHIAVAWPDFVGEDTSAAAVNNYGRTTTRPASWTATTDTDSVAPALPHTYTAFAQGVSGYNFNAPLLSLEMGIYYSDWRRLPADKIPLYVRMNAIWAAPYVMAYRIPLRLINNRAEVQRLINAGSPVGFVSHAKLSPDRTDPGIVPNGTRFPWNSPAIDTYPWAMFFKFLREEIETRIQLHGDVYKYKSSGHYVPVEITPEVVDINAGFSDAHILWAQETLQFLGYYNDALDKTRGPNTRKAIKTFQKEYNMVQDELPGPKTSRKMEEVMATAIQAIEALTKEVKALRADVTKSNQNLVTSIRSVPANVWSQAVPFVQGTSLRNTFGSKFRAGALLGYTAQHAYKGAGENVDEVLSEIRSLKDTDRSVIEEPETPEDDA